MSRMTQCVAMAAMLLASASFAQEGEAKALPLAEARSGIGEAIQDPAALTATMKQLSPEDQVAFVAAVNEAISKMAGSNEAKAADALNANKALLKGAAPGNTANILAEIFATAPVETLGLISESFAADLFNRDADPSRTYSDEDFAAIAKAMVQKIADRTSSSDDGGVRSAFGMMMMINASNGSPANLADSLADALPPEVREVAKSEWVPAATGEEKSYDSMIAYSSETTATSEPNTAVALQLAGPQMLDAMLADVAAGVIMNNEAATPIVDQAFGRFGENVINATDTGTGAFIADTDVEVNQQPDPSVPYNPGPYPGQEL